MIKSKRLKIIISVFNSFLKRLSKESVAFLLIFVEMKKILYQSKIQTPIGDMIVLASHDDVCLLEFFDRPEIADEIADLMDYFEAELVEESNPIIDNLTVELESYFKGELTNFKTPVIYTGTDFQKRVWSSLHDIPFGSTRTYKEQSEFLGDLKAIRAVANANGKNKLAIIVPCHRVIGTNGNLTGYAGGIERKRFLLELERKFGGQKDLFS